MFYSTDFVTGETKKIYSPKELVKQLEDTLTYFEQNMMNSRALANKTREELRQEVKKEYENELKNLHEWQRLTLIHFNSQKEKEDYENFWNKHNKKHYGTQPRKAVLNALILHPYGSGIGCGLVIECPECHEKKDITDSTCW